MTVLCVFFFFSSRRRHTRCSRDWSSDVCSSDLTSRPGLPRVSPNTSLVFGFSARRKFSGSRGETKVVSRSEEHTSELQSRLHLVCRLLLEKKKKKNPTSTYSSSTTYQREILAPH